MERIFIHVDMDAFFAAVEVRDNPALQGQPLIIGALPHERGVVSTCSYEARQYGVRSAMSIKEAYRRCPDGIYMHPDIKKYKEASNRIHRIWETYTDLIEYISLDEGYLDVTGSAHLFGGARQIGRTIKHRTKEETGLTCSVGIGYNMMSAKLASEELKPDGFFEIANAGELKKLIIDRDVRVLSGVGEKTAAALHREGFHTVRDIYNNPQTIRELFGNQGVKITETAAGIDPRTVAVDTEPKSIGRENTFQEDITDFDYVLDALLLFARELSFDIRQKQLYSCTTTLKITYSNMKSISRSKTGEPTNRAEDIFAAVREMLKTIEKRPIRLLGISLSHFTREPVRQLSFFDDRQDEQKKKADEAAYQLQKKFGKKIIKKGNELNAEKRFHSFPGRDGG